jgi:tRNA (guanine37-N1)-methyltransferase
MIYLTPRGKPLTQQRVRQLALESPGVVLLCGRYEGVDHRVIEHGGLEEVSIGDYVLSGGELAAQVLLDACVRLIPGVIGKQESLMNESFELGILEYPQYTKPQTWKNKIVPDVLLSGDHQKIAKWRQEEAERITQVRRPDLWKAYLDSRKNTL